jgi:hypothetical protein
MKAKLNGERTNNFSTNEAGTTEYPQAKEFSLVIMIS